MKFLKTALKGAFVVEPEPFQDHRGLFVRTFCKKEFGALGHKGEFVQFNHSHTNLKGALRGLHYQLPPYSEIKLIRCISGSVYDVIVDIREGSATFLQHFGVELSADNMKSIYVPEGFAHGFQTLEDHSELIYHHSNYYTPGHEGAIRYNDPILGIRWPLDPTDVSEKDREHILLNHHFKGIII